MSTPESEIDSILARLDGLRMSGNGWKARCPAHDDRHPSLSIAEGNDGNPLLHCFVGCTFEEILAALGLEYRPQTSPRDQPSPETTTDYDLIGPETAQIVATHRRIDYRDGTKTFFYLRDGSFGLDGLSTSALPLYGMSEAIRTPAGGTVVFTEGEKARDALTARGILSVGSACGAGGTPEDDQLRFLESFRVILWPDNDDAGREHMKRIASRLRELGVEVLLLEWPDAPHGGDAADFDGDDEALDALLQGAQPTSASEPADLWPPLAPAPTTLPLAPALQLELLTEPLQDLVVDTAERMFVPREMIAIPLLCGLSMLVARLAQVCPSVTDDWVVYPNLWGATVARPGMLKSPTLEKALGFLRPLEERAHAEYVAAEAEASADAQVLEAEVKEVKRRLGHALKEEQKRSPEERRKLDEESAVAAELLSQIDSETLSELDGPETVESLRHDLVALERQREEGRRTERRYRVTDATQEKIGELLIENPQGLLQVRDELAGFFASLDKPGREADRAFYLEAWEGNGDHRVDRIGRGSLHIPVMRLAVFGTIQPAKLEHYLGDAFSHGGGDDGLLQRFQLVVWPDELPPYEHQVKPENRRPEQRVARIAEELDRLAQSDDDVAVLHFDREAQQLWDAFRAELETRLRDGSLDRFPAFESYLAKHRSLMPSLALIFHVIERVDGGEPLGSICLNCTRRAAAFVDFLQAHARKIYAAELEPDRRTVVALARRIQNGDVEDGVTVRDLTRNKWKNLASQGDIWRALQSLEAAGWCRLEEQSPSSRGGRPSTIVSLHPDLLA